jgi:hypothetical protein
MSEQNESLLDLSFAAELRGQFERLAEGTFTPRASQSRRWLVPVAVGLCLLGAAIVSVYLGVYHPRAHQVRTGQPYAPGVPFVPSNGATANSVPPAWLITQAKKIAAENEDSSPTSAAYSLTIMRDAASAVGESADTVENPTLQVYLVVLTGNFTDENTFSPGGPAPQGTTIVYTVDADSHLIHDFGLVNGPVDTTPVGQMTAFSLP